MAYKEPNWTDINYKKEASMAWLNAMNNASILVSSHIESQKLTYAKNYVLIKEMLERYRNDIYQLNIIKIDQNAASAVSPDDVEP